MLATLNAGDEVIIPTPVLGQLPGHRDAGRRQAGAGAVRPEQRLQAARRGPGSGDHAAAPSGSCSTTRATRPAPPIRAADLQADLRRAAAPPACLGASPTTSTTSSPTTASSRPPSSRSSRGCSDRTLTMNGVLQGLCHDRLAHRLRRRPGALIKAMDKLQSQSTSNASSISQAAALEALTGPQDFDRGDAQGLSSERRDLVVDDAEPGAGHHLPQAGGRVLRVPLDARLHRQDHRQGRRRSPTTRASSSRCWTRKGSPRVHGAAFMLPRPFPHQLRHRHRRACARPAAASSASAAGCVSRCPQRQAGPVAAPRPGPAGGHRRR